MRLEHTGLRTGWLAVFAGWAMLVCLLAAFGLGSRLPPADDSGTARPLPAIPAAPRRTLGDLSRYAAIAERPVFAEDRQPHPFVMGGGEGQRAGDLRLTGVLITPQFQMATFTTDQGRSLRLRLHGEAIEGWRLLALAPRSATVEGAGGTRTLPLQVYDGQGGEPPTLLRTQPDAPGLPPRPAPPAPGLASEPMTRVPAPAAAPTPVAGPNEAQLQAIRERIEARRRALQTQNAQNNGGAATPPSTKIE